MTVLFLFYQATVAHAETNLVTLPITGTSPQSLPELANRILDILTSLAFPLALAAVIYTAYILINNNGKPEAWASAKKNLTYLAIGIGLIVFATVFLRLFTQFLCPGGTDNNQGGNACFRVSGNGS